VQLLSQFKPLNPYLYAQGVADKMAKSMMLHVQAVFMLSIITLLHVSNAHCYVFSAIQLLAFMLWCFKHIF